MSPRTCSVNVFSLDIADHQWMTTAHHVLVNIDAVRIAVSRKRQPHCTYEVAGRWLKLNETNVVELTSRNN